MCFKLSKCYNLRSLAFGLAAAVTYGLAVFIMSASIIMGYAPPEMAALHPEMTWSAVLMNVLWAIVEGFIFGWVFAFFYNMFICCISMCDKSDSHCGCGCSCGEKKPDVK